MKRRAIVLLGMGLALTSCGSGQSASSALPSTAQVQHFASSPAKSGDLLYVGDAVRVNGKFHGVLTLLTFPDGKAFGSVDLHGLARGLCGDASGNVWVVVQRHQQFNAYEFAHGGTSPIAHIQISHAGGAGDCAVDPIRGDLAVAVCCAARSTAGGDVKIWAGARPGKPATFALPFTPTSCAYDANGNLFVDGWSGDTVLFALAELSKGSRAFANVTLDKVPANYPGNVRWDGTYLDFVDNDFSRFGKIYRVDVSNYQGHVADVVHLRDLYHFAVFDIRGSQLAGTGGNDGRRLSVWAFPDGGKPVSTLAKFQFAPRGIAISVGSSH